MKKHVMVLLATMVVVGCAAPAPTEESRLKEAYSACINTAEGSPAKIEACQQVLDVLRKEKQHQAFAEKQQVQVMDYQRCINARKEGNDQEANIQCNRIWQEIHASNQSQ